MRCLSISQTTAIAIVYAVASAFISPDLACGQNKNYPPKLEGAQVEVYKQIGEVQLSVHIFQPTVTGDSKRPAIVFFFGGGWRSGSPKQFEQHCRYLSTRGMVAMTADYRVSSRHDVKAVSCVEDAKSAIRWIRENAERLRIDPNRVVAGGGSAGGHLAACTGVLAEFDQSGENLDVSSKPNAMALFNPALVLAPTDLGVIPKDKLAELEKRMGVPAEKLSPFHQLHESVPPTIIFHGKGDTTVPFATAELFTEKLKGLGGECQLVGYDEQPHGFFNFGRSKNKYFQETVRRLDQFLVEHEYLTGEPSPEALAILESR